MQSSESQYEPMLLTFVAASGRTMELESWDKFGLHAPECVASGDCEMNDENLAAVENPNYSSTFFQVTHTAVTLQSGPGDSFPSNGGRGAIADDGVWACENDLSRHSLILLSISRHQWRKAEKGSWCLAVRHVGRDFRRRQSL
jgi:hypothetical protein